MGDSFTVHRLFYYGDSCYPSRLMVSVSRAFRKLVNEIFLGKMDEINRFIAKKNSEGYMPREISRLVKNIYYEEISPKAIWSRIYRMKGKQEIEEGKENFNNIDILDEIEQEVGGLFKIGVLDMETTGLWADFGYPLVIIIKNIDTGKYEIFRLDKTESYSNIKNRKRPEFWRRLDRELLEKFRAEYEKYDIVVHYNGRWFDIKFINTRLTKNNLPLLPENKQLDIYRIARSKLRLRSKRLDALKEFLEIDEEEGGHKWEYWQMAANGMKEGFDFVTEHCKRDVDRLAKVAKKMRFYINYIRK